MHNVLNFYGRVALVTGGSQGIGKEVVEQLLMGGAKVYFWSLTPSRLEAALYHFQQVFDARQVKAAVVDVRSEIQVDEGVKQVEDVFGGIDILVNNAGVFGPAKSVLEYSVEEWQAVFDSNVLSQFLVSRAVVPGMMQRGYGRVVNMSSAVAKDGNPLANAYSSSKAAIMRFTQCLAREVAKTGVVVTAVAPSAARTALFDGVRQEVIDIMLKKVPMSRFATVSEIAALVCWLASEDNSFSTGSTFDICGGRIG